MAKLISSHDRISACFPLDTYPRPAEKSQYEGSRSLWSALDDDIITTEQAREIAIRCHERQIQHQQRWVNRWVPGWMCALRPQAETETTEYRDNQADAA